MTEYRITYIMFLLKFWEFKSEQKQLLRYKEQLRLEKRSVDVRICKISF